MITSIVELNDGDVVTQVEGQGPPKEFSASDGLLVIYQKGMLGHTNIEQRCHRNLLSPYRIETEHCGGNVPWANLVWPMTTGGREWKFARTSACDTCCSLQCTNRFRNVEPNHIKVVAMHDVKGRVMYQWCVAFLGNSNRLTMVPPSVVRNLVEKMSTDPTHPDLMRNTSPLLNLVGHQLTEEHDRHSFKAIAARRFMLYRRRVHVQVGRERNRVCVPVVPVLRDVHPGQCTICLEDTEVSRSSCVHKRCSIQVCVACRLKTRGMCALCDRSKLAPGAMFMCMMCDEPSTLDEFGYPCIKCGRPEACRHCYHRFGQCISCECDISSSFKRRRV